MGESPIQGWGQMPCLTLTLKRISMHQYLFCPVYIYKKIHELDRTQRAHTSLSAMTESESQNWDALSDHMKDKILDERLIDNLNGCSRPRPQKYHTLDRHSRRRARDDKIQSTLPNGKASVRLSTFGVEQVFPRLKIDAGQKEVTVEDTSNGFHTDDSSDNIVSMSLPLLIK